MLVASRSTFGELCRCRVLILPITLCATDHGNLKLCTGDESGPIHAVLSCRSETSCAKQEQTKETKSRTIPRRQAVGMKGASAETNIWKIRLQLTRLSHLGATHLGYAHYHLPPGCSCVFI
jgi:hypothetical protein